MALPLAHVGSGTYEPLQLLPLIAAAVAYWLRSRSLARRGLAPPVWRAACFAGGLGLILVALASPAAHLGEELVLAHMTQHLVIGDLAALLVVLGLTGPLIAPLFRVRFVDRLRLIAHPAVSLPLWAINLYFWHVPALYQGALEAPYLHALQHGLFVGLGVAMWMPLVGPLPKPAWFGSVARFLYVVAIRLTGAILGNVLMWSGKVLYPDYAAGEGFWEISPLADQGTAGAIMMAETGLVTLGLLAWLFIRAAREGEERQRLLDLADSRGVALDEARAARAVEAGAGGRLERRVRDGA
jgi:cytochrome c oxidase assembly factor CtaG